MQSPSRKPLGVRILAWIFIVVGCVEVLGFMLMAADSLFVSQPGSPRLPLGAALTGGGAGVITLILGFALRAFRRWVLILALVYLGLIFLSGLFSGHWVAGSVALLLLLYFVSVRDSFQSLDEQPSLSIIARPPPQRSINEGAAQGAGRPISS